MVKIGIVDTMFSRVDMGAIALDELKGYDVDAVRRTVPGIKDLPVECKRLLMECDVVMALGMVGGAPIDTQCAHEASIGIQHAKLMTGKHIIEVFVHENEAWSEREFFEICNNRVRKHAHNAINIVLHPEKMVEQAGKGKRQGKEDEGPIYPDAEKKIMLGLVVCDFNSEITAEMEKTAIAHIEANGAELGGVLHVPGAYDAPLAAKKHLLNKKIDGVVVLGAVIKGETLHDETIGNSTAHALSQLSLQFNKPVTLGIIGPGASYEQAEARKTEYAERAVDAALKLVKLLRR